MKTALKILALGFVGFILLGAMSSHSRAGTTGPAAAQHASPRAPLTPTATDVPEPTDAPEPTDTPQPAPLASAAPQVLHCLEDDTTVRAQLQVAVAILKRDGLDSDLSELAKQAATMQNDCTDAKVAVDTADVPADDSADRAKQEKVSTMLEHESQGAYYITQATAHFAQGNTDTAAQDMNHAVDEWNAAKATADSLTGGS